MKIPTRTSVVLLGLIPGLGRSPEEGKGYPLQYFGLDMGVLVDERMGVLVDERMAAVNG